MRLEGAARLCRSEPQTERERARR
eukprot:SAG11_NODE_24089_length_378_cov_0.928315_1_plen_23_part_10